MVAMFTARKQRDGRREVRFRFAHARSPRIVVGMNLKFPALVLSLALVPAALADVTVTLKDVHLCCDNCVKGVDKAVAPVAGVAAKSDKDESTVTITAPDQAT